jgi:hypothetical protein
METRSNSECYSYVEARILDRKFCGEVTLFVHDGFIGAVRFSEQKTRTEIKEAMKRRICVKALTVTA